MEENRIVYAIVCGCHGAAIKGNTNYSFEVSRHKGTNLCFPQEVRFDEVLEYIKKNCQGCEVSFVEQPDHYLVTVDWM